MPRMPINSDFVTALGNYLGYGAIGLGLGVAVLSAILLMLKKPGALAAGTRFMMFGVALVVIGAGLELVKAYEHSAETERAFISSQNLPDEFWNDFLLSRQQKLFGTAEPTDEFASGSMKDGELRSLNIFIPKGECRFYFAAARPPAKIDAMIRLTTPDVVNRSLRDEEYYRTGKVCTSMAKASQEVELQIQMHGTSGQFSISAFKGHPMKPQYHLRK